MKYLLTFLLASAICCNLNAQNTAVGIGTTTPSSNAVLDVTSTNKGLMLPRVNDTTNIANPSAGLFIYNKRSNSPNYYNGTQWRGVTDAGTGSTGDSITMTIAGGTEFGTVKSVYQGNSFTIAAAGGGGGAGRTTVGDLSFSKRFDSNTIVLRKAGITQTRFSNIEFKYYRPGVATPYYSIKLTDVSAIASSDQSNSVDGIFENYQLYFTRIGYKDWINNSSFSYTVATGVVATY